MNRITLACLASAAAFVGGLATWFTIKWYKNRGSRDKKRVRKVAEEQENNEAIARQLT